VRVFANRVLGESLDLRGRKRLEDDRKSRRDREGSIRASYSGGPGFKCQISTVVIEENSGLDLKLRHGRFFPHSFQFTLH
jgi:hypothetical protein